MHLGRSLKITAKQFIEEIEGAYVENIFMWKKYFRGKEFHIYIKRLLNHIKIKENVF